MKTVKTVMVGWEHEVPVSEIEAARDNQRSQLVAFCGSDADGLTDHEVARFLVRTSHPSSRYLRRDVTGLGYSMRSA